MRSPASASALLVSSFLLGVVSLGTGCNCGGTPPGNEDGGPDSGQQTECTALDTSQCVTLHGAPPCGAYACVGGLCQVSCPGCTDNDHDGFGTGTTADGGNAC